MDCLFIVRDLENSSIHQELVDRDSTYDALVNKLKGSLALQNFSLFYNDEEGDEVRISSDAELRECFNIAEDNSVTFYVVPQAANAEPAKPKEEEKKAPAPEPEQFSPEWIGKQIPVLQQFVGEFLKKDHPLGNLISEITGESCSDLENMLNREASKFQKDIAKLSENLAAERAAKVETKTSAKTDDDFPALHTHVFCDVCDEEIVGIRYKCINCVNYDLCQACEEANLKMGHHDPEHLFLKVYKPVSLPSHRAFPSFYNRPAGAHGWMGWTGDKRNCPWKMARGMPENMGRHHNRKERKDKFKTLEENMKQLQEELKTLKEQGIAKVEAPVVEEVPVPEPVQVVEDAPVEVVREIPDEPVDTEVNLLEQSTAGFSPELLAVFEQIIGLGFKDYFRIAELVRQHNGDVNVIVMELLNEMRQSVSA